MIEIAAVLSAVVHHWADFCARDPENWAHG